MRSSEAVVRLSLRDLLRSQSFLEVEAVVVKLRVKIDVLLLCDSAEEGFAVLRDHFCDLADGRRPEAIDRVEEAWQIFEELPDGTRREVVPS
jgi:hypothetical protein